MALSDYLDAASRTPFAWGRHDCCQFVRRWVQAGTGRDPAAGWRYDTEMGAALLVRRHGGLLALLDALAVQAGLSRTDDPQAGDVGAVVTLTERGLQPVAAICTGPCWAFLTHAGLSRARVKPLASWRLHG